jgi:hypothetical protein
MKLHADRFKKGGVEIFNVGKDGTKTLKTIPEIFAQIAKSPLMKDPQALAKAFGRGEGEAGFRITAEHVEKINELMRAGHDETSIQADLNTYLTSSVGRMEIAWNNVKLAIAAAFTPERIEKFAAGLEKVAALAGKTIDFLSNAADLASTIVNGPDFEQGKNYIQADLLELQQSQGRDAAAKYAKTMLNMDERGADFIGGTRYGSAEAARAGSLAYLQSIGQAADPQTVGRAIGRELATYLGPFFSQPTTVKIGPDPVVKAYGNATSQRTRPGGRS